MQPRNYLNLNIMPPDLIDGVSERDREWFTSHRQRWRIRPVDPVELDHLGRAIAPTVGQDNVQILSVAYVLMIAAPSRRILVRHFFGGEPSRRPDDILPSAVRLLGAKTDDASIRRLGALAWRAGVRMPT